MKVRAHSLFGSIKGLVFVYLLLALLTVLFTRSFFWETLHEGRVPDTLGLVVFFSAPAALLVFLGITLTGFLVQTFTQRAGTKFRIRLLLYFLVIVVFSAAPITLVTSVSISEMLRFWHSIPANEAKDAGRSFAVGNYAFHLERFQGILSGNDWNVLIRSEGEGRLPEHIVSVQEFALDRESGQWEAAAFVGRDSGRLPYPPPAVTGFPVREFPRDRDMVRGILVPEPGRLILVSYSLGEGFDSGRLAIERQAERFEVIGVLRDNVRILELFYYGVFFFPPLLMTMIIAISFTRRISGPIAELTEATGKVASGDFSVRLLWSRSDEIGQLVASFNSMVQDLESSRSALIRSEKLSVWQNMAGQLAHEIKNPLTPIKLSAERVLRRWRSEPERLGEIVEDSMMAIIQETEGLSTLLNEFRTLSRPMEPSVSWIRFADVLPEVIAPYQSSYPEIGFELFCEDCNPPVKIDRSRFSRLLANLLLNAIDASEGKGLIQVRGECVKKKGLVYCRISVKDFGKGIRKEDFSGVFTPYFTTKPSGTGLGLPIVERIVNEHGGSIWFESEEGLGTVFYVDLPTGESEGPDGPSSEG